MACSNGEETRSALRKQQGQGRRADSGAGEEAAQAGGIPERTDRVRWGRQPARFIERAEEHATGHGDKGRFAEEALLISSGVAVLLRQSWTP